MLYGRFSGARQATAQSRSFQMQWDLMLPQCFATDRLSFLIGCTWRSTSDVRLIGSKVGFGMERTWERRNGTAGIFEEATHLRLEGASGHMLHVVQAGKMARLPPTLSGTGTCVPSSSSIPSNSLQIV